MWYSFAFGWKQGVLGRNWAPSFWALTKFTGSLFFLCSLIEKPWFCAFDFFYTHAICLLKITLSFNDSRWYLPMHRTYQHEITSKEIPCTFCFLILLFQWVFIEMEAQMWWNIKWNTVVMLGFYLIEHTNCSQHSNLSVIVYLSALPLRCLVFYWTILFSSILCRANS